MQQTLAVPAPTAAPPGLRAALHRSRGPAPIGDDIEMVVMAGPSTAPRNNLPARLDGPDKFFPWEALPDELVAMIVAELENGFGPSGTAATIRADLRNLALVNHTLGDLALNSLAWMRADSIGASITHPSFIDELEAGLAHLGSPVADAIRISSVRHGIAFASPMAADYGGDKFATLLTQRRRREAATAGAAASVKVLGSLAVAVGAPIVVQFEAVDLLASGVGIGLQAFSALIGTILLVRSAPTVLRAHRQIGALKSTTAMVAGFSGAWYQAHLADGQPVRLAIDSVKTAGLDKFFPDTTRGPDGVMRPVVANSAPLILAACVVNVPSSPERFRASKWAALDACDRPSPKDQLAMMAELLLDRSAPPSFVGLAPLSPADGDHPVLDELERLGTSHGIRPEFARALRNLAPHLDKATPAERIVAFERLLPPDGTNFGSYRGQGQGLILQVEDDDELSSVLGNLDCVQKADLAPADQTRIARAISKIRADRGLGVRPYAPTTFAQLATAMTPLLPAPESMPDLASLTRYLDQVDMLRLTSDDDERAVDVLRRPLDLTALATEDRLDGAKRVLQSVSRVRTQHNHQIVRTTIRTLTSAMTPDNALQIVRLLAPAIGAECCNPRALISLLDTWLRTVPVSPEDQHAIGVELKARVAKYPVLLSYHANRPRSTPPTPSRPALCSDGYWD